jgi:hemerythrin
MSISGTMSLLTWKETYSVNSREMDEQHKQLINLLNQLHDGMARGAGNEVMRPVLDTLVAYTRAHFADEERTLAGVGYPRLLQHKAEHKELTDKVVKFRDDFAAGKVGLSINVLMFLKDWLNHHIVGSDKLYAPYLVRRQA